MLTSWVRGFLEFTQRTNTIINLKQLKPRLPRLCHTLPVLQDLLSHVWSPDEVLSDFSQCHLPVTTNNSKQTTLVTNQWSATGLHYVFLIHVTLLIEVILNVPTMTKMECPVHLSSTNMPYSNSNSLPCHEPPS